MPSPLIQNKQPTAQQRLRASLRARVRADFFGGHKEISATRNIEHVHDSITFLVKGLSLTEGMEEARLIEAWEDLVGGFIAQHTKPTSLKQGRLRLRVLQPSMRFHLEQEKGRLLRKLQNEFSPRLIQSIQFILG